MEKKKYSVIYADPPWQFKAYSAKGMGRSAEKHYPTMDIEAIKGLPVGELADRDCALFLWVTFPPAGGAGRPGELGLHLQDGGLRLGQAEQEGGQSVLGAGVLDAGQRRGLPPCHKGEPQPGVRRRPSGDPLPHRGTQQETPGGAGAHRPAHGRCPPDRAVRPDKAGGLGCLGERGQQ